MRRRSPGGPLGRHTVTMARHTRTHQARGKGNLGPGGTSRSRWATGGFVDQSRSFPGPDGLLLLLLLLLLREWSPRSRFETRGALLLLLVLLQQKGNGSTPPQGGWGSGRTFSQKGMTRRERKHSILLRNSLASTPFPSHRRE